MHIYACASIKKIFHSKACADVFYVQHGECVLEWVNTDSVSLIENVTIFGNILLLLNCDNQMMITEQANTVLISVN